MAQPVSERLIPIPRVVNEGGRRGFLVAILVGAALAVPFLIVPAFFSDEVVLNFFGVLLGVVASVYLGFALSDGRYKSLNFEQMGIIVFTVLATVAITKDKPLLIAAGFFGHALWDALHPHPLSTTTPRWYGPVCIGFDVVVAVYLFLRFA